MVRIRCLMSQACVPSACHSGFMNSAASQSSSSGCVGHSPCEPRSSSIFEMPCRRTARHTRLTKTRAVSGFAGETSQFARSSRVARRPPVSSLPRKAGMAGCTISPDSSIQLPRAQNAGLAPASVASETTTRGIAASSSAASCSSLRHLDRLRPALPATPTGNARRSRPSAAAVRLSPRPCAARCSTGVGNLLALLGASARRNRSAESARRKRPEGGAAELGIVVQAHRHHGIGVRVSTGLAKRSASIALATVVVGRAPPSRSSGSPSNAAIGGYSARRIGQVGRCRPKSAARLPPDFRLDFGDHHAIGAARHAHARAGPRPAPPRCPSAVHVPAPGLNVTV